jgi:hypothetical protein
MSRYDIENKLQELQSQGQNLIPREPSLQPEINDTRAWLAAVNDTLRYLLPSDSSLFKEFETINSRFSDPDSWPEGSLSEVVSQVNRILKYVEPSLQLQRLQEQRIRFSDEEKNRLEQQLENKVSASIVDKYFKSWKIWIPSFILVAAAAFAILSLFKIHNYSVNIQEIHEKEIEKAMDKIEATEKNIIETLDNRDKTIKTKLDGQIIIIKALEEQLKTIQTNLGDKRKRIKTEVGNLIKKPQEEKAPKATEDLNKLRKNLSDAKEKLGSISEKIENYEKIIPILKDTVEAVKLNSPGILESAAVILKWSVAIIIFIVAASGLAIILSIIALWNSLKRKRDILENP